MAAHTNRQRVPPPIENENISTVSQPFEAAIVYILEHAIFEHSELVIAYTPLSLDCN